MLLAQKRCLRTSSGCDVSSQIRRLVKWIWPTPIAEMTVRLTQALMDHVLGIPSGVLPAMSLLNLSRRGAHIEPSQHFDHHETMTVDLPSAVSSSIDFDVVDDARRGEAMWGFVDVGADERVDSCSIPGYWSVSSEAKQELLLTQVTLIWTGSCGQARSQRLAIEAVSNPRLVSALNSTRPFITTYRPETTMMAPPTRAGVSPTKQYPPELRPKQVSRS